MAKTVIAAAWSPLNDAPRPVIDPRAEVIPLRCCAPMLRATAERMILIYGSYRCMINGRRTQVVGDNYECK